MRLLRILFALALVAPSLASGAYTEFYCRTDGTNINAGSTTNADAIFTFTSGNWTNTTGWFLATGADLSGITTQMWASVYPDGATVAVFIGMITNVDDTADTIGISNDNKSGTKPTDGTGNRTIKIGGAWKGPNGADTFPINFVERNMTNLNLDRPRVNLHSATNFTTSAGLTRSATGPIVFQGFSSVAGDGGRAEINGPTAGASINILTTSGSGPIVFEDLIFATNGSSGSAGAIWAGAQVTTFRSCVFHDVMGSGGEAHADSIFFVECEAYNCNLSGTANKAGFDLGFDGTISQAALRCISHHNLNTNANGFIIGTSASTPAVLISCIAATNGADGFRIYPDGPNGAMFIGCDAYANSTNGINLTTSSTDESLFYIENSNFIKNGAQGIAANAGQIHSGHIVNCGFGSGTQTNAGGNLGNTGAMNVIGSVTYAADVTPWTDPGGGDFRVSLSTAKGDGRGTFLQTSGGSGTVAYPDIGAAQHQDSGGGGGGTTYLFVQ